MTIYNFYIFDRRGSCLWYREWLRPFNSLSEGEDGRLMFGMLFSLKEMIGKMGGGREDLQTMRTPAYATHVFETVTGLRFVMNTDAQAQSCRPELEHIYSSIFVDKIVMDPLYDPAKGPPKITAAFERALEAYLRQRPIAQHGF